MENKMVVITGAAGGLGKAVATKFFDQGWSITMIDRNQEELEALKVKLEQDKKNDQVINAFVVDLSDAEQIYSFLDNQLVNSSSWKCLVNNAGVSLGGDAYANARTDYEVWNTVMSINVGAPYILSTGFVVNAKKHTTKGSIINVSSMVGLVGAKKPSYAASKAAMLGLTKSFAMQCGPNVRVNAVCPGAMDTPMTADWDLAKREKISLNTPIGHIANPSEIADIIYFLASDEAKYMTGAVINATGGQYLGQ